jgi:hypothetical protein
MSLNDKSPLVKSFITFTAGLSSGIASKLVEYPFDTVKVKLQTQGQNNLPVIYNSTFDCFKKIYMREGVVGYYRGVLAPVAGACVELGLTFWAYHFSLDLLKIAYQYTSDGKRVLDPTNLNLFEVGYGGAMCGVFTTFLMAPIELVKCKMQVQANRLETLEAGAIAREQGVIYRGLTHVLIHTIKTQGFKGAFRGFIPTMGREVLGNFAWFLNYEIGKKFLKERLSNDLWISMLSGGFAGFGYWSLGMPADRIKSILQTEIAEKRSVTKTFKDILKKEGVRGFYKGYAPTVIRAIPSNAVIFSVYEMSLKMLNSLF